MTTDPSNCGGCGRACPAGRSCVNGACACDSAQPTYCPATGTCVDTQTDPANCGGCGMPCTGSGIVTCVSGGCVSSPCPSGTWTYAATSRTCNGESESITVSAELATDGGQFTDAWGNTWTYDATTCIATAGRPCGANESIDFQNLSCTLECFVNSSCPIEMDACSVQ